MVVRQQIGCSYKSSSEYFALIGNFAISDVLGNVHCYYSQFSARVTVAMETLTAKVVKDFKVLLVT